MDITALLNSSKNIPIDIGFSDACRPFNRDDETYKMPLFIERSVIPCSYEHTDTILVAFSGGKLSLACAFRYKDIGKDIVLMHIAKPGEDVSRIKKISKMLDVPLYIHYENVCEGTYSTMYMLYLVLCHAIDMKYSPKIVYGYFDTASIYNNAREHWKNCTEFIGSFKNVAKKYVDGFTILNPIPNYSVMWDEILKHKAYIPYIEYANNEDRRVFDNIKMDYRVDKEDKATYLKNFSILTTSYKRKKKASQASIYEIWNNYFFYRIENSICYKELMEKSVSSI